MATAITVVILISGALFNIWPPVSLWIGWFCKCTICLLLVRQHMMARGVAPHRLDAEHLAHLYYVRYRCGCLSRQPKQTNKQMVTSHANHYYWNAPFWMFGMKKKSFTLKNDWEEYWVIVKFRALIVTKSSGFWLSDEVVSVQCGRLWVHSNSSSQIKMLVPLVPLSKNGLI